MKEFKFTIDGKQYNAAVNELEDNFAEVTLNGKTYKVELEKEEALQPQLYAVPPLLPLLQPQLPPD